MDFFEKNGINVNRILQDYKGILETHTDSSIEDAEDAIRKHLEGWMSFTMPDERKRFLDELFSALHQLPEYKALQEKYKDRML